MAGKTERRHLLLNGRRVPYWLRLPSRLDPAQALPLIVCVAIPGWERNADAARALTLALERDEPALRARAIADVQADHAVVCEGRPEPTRLQIELVGLRSDQGAVAALLFAGPEGFPDDDRRALGDATTRPRDGRATLTFPKLAPGLYAAVMLHDENDNQKMDTSLGFPLEGYGCSNNPKPLFRGPRWSEGRFLITGAGAERRIRVEAIYLHR
jgi:uncharacterized protein (DUF2141 family)